MTPASASDSHAPVTALPLPKVKHPSMVAGVAGKVPAGGRKCPDTNWPNPNWPNPNWPNPNWPNPNWPNPNWLERPHLVQRLLASNEPLVVVAAPPGYGKTTLLRQWEVADERPFAWAGSDPGTATPTCWRST